MLAPRSTDDKLNGSADVPRAVSKRIPGLDIAKVFAMFQVVYIHFAFYTNNVANTFASRSVLSLTVTCVPLFIAVNGAILFSRPFDMRKHVRRTIAAIVLLFLWRAIHLIVLRSLGAPELAPVQFASALIGGEAEGYVLGHFWFLYALVRLYVLFPLLKLAWDKYRRALYPLLAALFILYSCVDGIRTGLLMVSGDLYDGLAGIFNSFFAFTPLFSEGYLVLYFVGGALVFEFFKSLQNPEGTTATLSRKPVALALALAVVSSLLTVLVKQLQYVHSLGTFGVSYGYWLPSTVALTFAFLLLFLVAGQAIARPCLVRLFTVLGSGTFAVYMMHIPALQLFAQLEPGLVAQATGNALFVTQTGWAFLIFVALLLAGLLLKRIPFVGRLFVL